MADQYPFVLANGRMGNLFDALGTAARPPKFSQEFLRAIGFTSSNDRAIIPLFRKLGFIDDNSNPTDYYDKLRDKQLRSKIIGDRLRETYADLFAINTKIYEASEDELKGALSRVTGKDAATVQRYANTFKALSALSDFDSNQDMPAAKPQRVEPSGQEDQPPPPHTKASARATPQTNRREFHYNIQIHLPATSDMSVYNAIFRALKDNLDI